MLPNLFNCLISTPIITVGHDFVKTKYGCFLKSRHHMGVGVEGNSYGGMSQPPKMPTVNGGLSFLIVWSKTFA